MVELVPALRSTGLHQLRGVGRLRQRHVHRLGTLQRQVQVLLVQRDAETRVEGPLDHALAMHFQNAAGRETAHQRLAHLGRVGASLAGKQQRLAHRGNVERDDDLVRHLGGLAVAVAADQCDVLANQFEQRLDAVKNRLWSADHDGQAAGLGADLAARDWRVEVVAAQRVDPGGKGLGLDRRDAAHVNHGLASGQSGGHTALAEQHLCDVGRVRQHHEDDVSLLGHLTRAGADGRAGQLGRHLAAGIDEQAVPSLEQVTRHRRTHDAQSDEAQLELV